MAAQCLLNKSFVNFLRKNELGCSCLSRISYRGSFKSIYTFYDGMIQILPLNRFHPNLEHKFAVGDVQNGKL